MTPRALAALFALAAAAASADIFGAENAANKRMSRIREVKVLGVPQLPAGCLHEGRWFMEGASVSTREACLRCRCARGALACARAACQAPPDPPPRRCHLRHRRGACCPELHCPDGVTTLEHSASGRLDDEPRGAGDAARPAPPAGHAAACVEGGTVFAAGSALSARAACEQCFCLRGARHCVRPRCLPPPPGCSARPAPGACCPQRYYCDGPARAGAAEPLNRTNPHDCEVEGVRVSEGERVPAAEGDCAQCFCLRARVHCQPLTCAPVLHGCAPLLRPGRCCPHQYSCNHTHTQDPVALHVSPISHNALVSMRNDDRSLDTSKSNIYETTTKTISTSPVSNKNTLSELSIKEEHVSTGKVKRKTSEAPPSTATHKPKHNITVANTKRATTVTSKFTTKDIHKLITKLAPTTPTSTITSSTTTEAPSTASTEASLTIHPPSTEQPEGTVRIMINGTINCSAELSHLPFNKTVNKTEENKAEAHWRAPGLAGNVSEAQTSGPVDIITDRNVNGGFDENETFTINVTSSLRTNTSHTTSPPLTTSSESVSTDQSESLNISKKNKEDYDYDYTEPTLPPSLPNLKIIPFVAADAVVDEDVPDKGTFTYPAAEREDKFPVYFPSKQSEPPFATRREDVFSVHPVLDSDQYRLPAPGPAYAHAHNDLASNLHKLTVSTALEPHISGSHKFTKPPSSNTKSESETPAVNLFSPPVETEGGFIPKGPGIIDQYYAVYPSTPAPPSLPHLTTSMQLDTGKDCISSDGRLVSRGASIAAACAVCTCTWGELHCSPRACPAPSGCHRRPANVSAGDVCCGQLICHQDNKTTMLPPELSTRKTEITLNLTKVPVEIPSDISPPVRREPVADRAVTNKPVKVEENLSDKYYSQENTTSQMSIADNSATGLNSNETSKQQTTNRSSPSTTTEKSTTAMNNVIAVQEVTQTADMNETSNQSQEYEDEEEDEGFSFGSVLKLLLSDSYDSTTTPPKKKPPATTNKAPTTITTAAPKLYSTTRRVLSKPTVAPFIPLPSHHYASQKKVYQPNTINRIDHLVLGEATAIRKPSTRPVSTTAQPGTTSFKPYTRPSTSRPITTTRPLLTKKEEHKNPPTPARPPAPAATPGVGGLLKLAGCNIYGQMYRVGRIITELSTPCQECRCTDLGVTCRPLAC